MTSSRCTAAEVDARLLKRIEHEARTGSAVAKRLIAKAT